MNEREDRGYSRYILLGSKVITIQVILDLFREIKFHRNFILKSFASLYLSYVAMVPLRNCFVKLVESILKSYLTEIGIQRMDLQCRNLQTRQNKNFRSLFPFNFFACSFLDPLFSYSYFNKKKKKELNIEFREYQETLHCQNITLW